MGNNQGIPGIVKIANKIERGDKNAMIPNKEIEVVESIIQVLKKCYDFHMKNYQYLQAAQCLKDISICKKELKKIKDRRLASENAHNG